MKARVIATGEIVNVVVKEIPQYSFLGESTGPIEYRITKFYDGENYYRYDELDFEVEPFDYWTRLEHQYAGMAMQGILACEEWKISPREGVSFAGEVALQAQDIAHALVEKMKNKEE